MYNSQIIAFLPCRKGSQRIKQKNTRAFAGIEGGLTKIKVEQLVNCKEIDEIVISTDDDDVIAICNEILSASTKKFKIDVRPKNLASSETSTDELINYVEKLIPEGDILWTHVTSPFITTDIYSDVINKYKEQVVKKACDSLTTVTKHQKFFWNEQLQSINYDRSLEKWPRTQTITPIYELNSGIFLANVDIYRKFGDRIGVNPYLYELNRFQTTDIDWEEDFEIAEILWLKNNSY